MDDRVKAARLVAQIGGIVKGWLRKRLREMSYPELFALGQELRKRTDYLAGLDSPYSIPPYGLRFKLWREHPMSILITDEEILRDFELEKEDPRKYWGPIYDLSSEDLDDYNRWLQETFRDHLWRMSTEDRLALWRRDRGRDPHVRPSRERVNAGASKLPPKWQSVTKPKATKDSQEEEASHQGGEREEEPH